MLETVSAEVYAFEIQTSMHRTKQASAFRIPKKEKKNFGANFFKCLKHWSNLKYNHMLHFCPIFESLLFQFAILQNFLYLEVVYGNWQESSSPHFFEGNSFPKTILGSVLI